MITAAVNNVVDNPLILQSLRTRDARVFNIVKSPFGILSSLQTPFFEPQVIFGSILVDYGVYPGTSRNGTLPLTNIPLPRPTSLP